MPDHDLARADAGPHHDVGELQQVEDVSLVAVAGPGRGLLQRAVARPPPSLGPRDVVLAAAAARHLPHVPQH